MEPLRLPVVASLFLSLCLSFQYTSKLEGIRDFFIDTVETVMERAKGNPPRSNRTLVDLVGFLNILMKQVDRIVVNPSFQPVPDDDILLRSAMFEMDCEFDKVKAFNDSKLTNTFMLSDNQIVKYKNIIENTKAVIRNITEVLEPSY